MTERIGVGRVAEVFAWGEGLVIKVAREAEYGPWLAREAQAQAIAAAAGAPVPAVFEMTTYEGRPAFVMERVEGTTVLRAIEGKPWRAWSLGKAMGRAHARLHRTVAPDELIAVEERITTNVSAEGFPAGVRAAVLVRLEGLPKGDRLCHGDFHPDNLMTGPKGLTIIDLDASRGAPAADIARTLMILEIGMPVDASFVMRQLIRALRRVMRAAYLRGYREVAPVDMRLVNRWKVVQVGARLAENITSERGELLRRLRVAGLAPGQDR